MTDSLPALRLLKAWGRAEMPAKRMTEHPDRRLVRRLLKEAKEAGFPTTEKVKAHDERALEAPVPKAVGNTEADRQAKRAVKERAGPGWQGEGDEFGDPMELRTKSGALVNDWKTEFERAAWAKMRSARSALRAPKPVLERLYPQGWRWMRRPLSG